MLSHRWAAVDAAAPAHRRGPAALHDLPVEIGPFNSASLGMARLEMRASGFPPGQMDFAPASATGVS